MNVLSSEAFDVCIGTITHVNVEIGYASFAFFGGFTIDTALSAGSFFTLAAAAAIPRRPGSWYLPAEFFTAANVKWFFSEYAMSTYVIAPFVWLSVAATPELPFEPTPVGQFTATPLPGPLRHAPLTRDR